MRLALLPGGSVYLDKGRAVTPGVDVGVRVHVPVWSALIETDDGRRILLDTGMHPDHIGHPDATYEGTKSAGLMPAVMTFNDLLPNRLQQLGISTNGIDTVILSHLHWDHCGQTHLFPRATVHVRQDCLETWGQEVNPRVGRRDFLTAAETYQFLPDRETSEFAPGVTVIHTPGHAVGHISLMVALRETGFVLLPVDALPMRECVDGTSIGAGPDPEAWKRSRALLLRLAGEHEATFFLSHDPDQWPRLRRAPHWYD
jgi:N-acyl homoserine lactone hydrolase